MAGSSLFALIDDIASILDDVSVMTKVAAKKTAGVLGDDLALNAQQVAGVRADRELPVVWAVAKGSLGNKAILVPAALLISAVAGWAIIPLLILGGLYLCYEGVEKLAHHRVSGHGAATGQESGGASAPERVLSEKEKIRGAVRTDFILSAEIIVITLGTMASASLPVRATVLAGVAFIMTVGVYGAVAGIVKLDDIGLYLQSRSGNGTGAGLLRRTGRFLLQAAPMLMKTLSIVGTIAMFMVGGGILMHNIAPMHHFVESLQSWAAPVPAIGGLLGGILSLLAEILLGVAAGALALFGAAGGKALVGRLKKRA
ncbi:MAG: DUF808 domain-containing protein [Azoarcus sp.]|jgi:predicted DNA repair protein MutK|nr:DUF808 domain-containing protein [Azoarcus sp.]